MKKYVTITLIILSAACVASFSQGGHEVSCMFYNVENLFLPADATGEGDDDFTPGGNRRWNEYRYYRKIAAVCKVILAVNGWDPPSVICLSEIENKQVLEDLCFHPLLAVQDYGILHRNSPDHRGMDVAILYRRDLVVCIDTSWITIRTTGGREVATREMVSARFACRKDTFHVVACHWTSKYGGALETEKFRIQQAHALGRHTDSIVQAHPGITVLAGGDMNDVSGSAPLNQLESGYALSELHPAGRSTYKYQGNWESIDHVFAGGVMPSSQFRVVVPEIPLLLEEDEKYTGLKPFRTYSGFRYNGGISDHLPLLVCFFP